MNTLHELPAYWLVRSLGWTLLHFCWQGALIALILWCALQLLARRPAQERYIAACIGLGLLVALPLITFTRIGLNEYRLAMELKNSAISDNATLVVQAGFGHGASWLARLASVLEPTLPWVLAAWFVGLFVSLIRLSVGLSVARRMRLAATSPASAALQQMFATLKQRLGILRPANLMNSALVQVPTVVGWLRPVVLLPVSCFTGLSDMQIEAILCHELAHIRRHDYLVSVVQSIVEAVLFYHPAVWWVSQQLRRERECCCDDMAVTAGGNALAYARALSALEARRGSYPELVLGSNGGVLTMRIKRLLQCEEVSAVPQVAAIVVLALLTISAGAIAGTARAQSQSAPKVLVQVDEPVVAPVVAAFPAMPSLAPIAPHSAYKAALAAPAAKPAPATEAVPAAAATAPEPPQQQAAPTGPVRIAAGVVAGQIVSKVSPIYPPIAKAACVEGTVVLHALIGKTGDVTALQVVSGPAMLRASALDAVRQWKYQPYLLNGEPTEVDTTISVSYTMNDTQCQPAQNDGPDANGVVPRTIGGSVSAPVLLHAVDPEFSEEARADKVSGIVMVHLWVDEQGHPTHVQVVRGLGHGLDEKALEAVRRYRFSPALENGKPVVVALNTEIQFSFF